MIAQLAFWVNFLGFLPGIWDLYSQDNANFKLVHEKTPNLMSSFVIPSKKTHCNQIRFFYLFLAFLKNVDESLIKRCKIISKSNEFHQNIYTKCFNLLRIRRICNFFQWITFLETSHDSDFCLTSADLPRNPLSLVHSD